MSDNEEIIRFLKIDEAFGCFSNFWPCDIEYQGLKYPTSEHLYQARKYEGTDERYVGLIRKAESAWDAAALGRRGRFIRSNWDDIRVTVMEEVLFLKFDQNADIRKVLLATEDRTIQEVYPGEDFWSIGPDGNGRNMLGKCLMRTREKLREKHGPYTENQLLKDGIMSSFMEDS